MSIEIVNEPPPPARAASGGKGKCDVNVRLIAAKTNEVVQTLTSRIQENERQERESRKY